MNTHHCLTHSHAEGQDERGDQWVEVSRKRAMQLEQEENKQEKSTVLGIKRPKMCTPLTHSLTHTHTPSSPVRKQHQLLGEATMSHMAISEFRLAEKTGGDLLYELLHERSDVEERMGILKEYCTIAVGVTHETALSLLKWQIYHISDWLTVSQEEAMAFYYQKEYHRSSPSLVETTLINGSTLLSVERCLSAWHNIIVALCRGFELLPDSPLVQALWKIDCQMRQYLKHFESTIGQNSDTSDEFCSFYLTAMLRSVCCVMGSFHSTAQDITDMVRSIRVATDTPHYDIAMRLMNLEQKKLMRELREQATVLVATTHSNKNNTKRHRRKRSKSTSVVKSRIVTKTTRRSHHMPPCFHFHTTVGCFAGKNCAFKHLKAKPSLSEERTIRDAVKKCNARYPTKIPLEVDEDKV